MHARSVMDNDRHAIGRGNLTNDYEYEAAQAMPRSAHSARHREVVTA